MPLIVALVNLQDMYNKRYAIILIGCLIIIAGACHTLHTGKAIATKEAQPIRHNKGSIYTVDTTTSYISWKGKKPAGAHYGSLHLNSGSMSVAKNDISGSFSIAIGSLEPKDGKAKKREMLRKHLLSDDFFDVVNFPEANFEITSTKYISGSKYLVAGNLKMKSMSKNIEFPADIIFEKNKMMAKADMVIDRTMWGLNYGNDKSLGNWFIYPDVAVRLDITAYKKM